MENGRHGGDTVLVKDILSGTDSSIPQGLTAVGGTLFFNAADDVHGHELWKSDGTVLVKDIWPGGGSSFPQWLTDINGTLFFSANDGVTGEELWTSDGTATGTVLAANVVPGSGGAQPSGMTAFNGQVLFAARNDGGNIELWRLNLDSDGDGVNDNADNCPTVYNPGQEQTGNNVGSEFGDACVDPTVYIPDDADIAPDVSIGAAPISTGVHR